ncbi:hypothetical protein [uncultured Cocleimonas sp.]|jgi:predicted transcriptional regulator of viral defense system|uniref:type IV toxin-antitoxin system AbiEi family antitoxin domain-containing protein n=1 Tax=uncultured Cocleimonas sp. TaxID=1051587 RepID=UPI002639387B|nr:hypothetical protein [uncultured Cocleimonas sp.]
MNHLESLANPVINHATLVSVLGSYARPNDKISELIAKHQLVPLKRGLYLIADSQQPSLELIANHLHGPSYVSRHWALSYYGLLTEQVSVVTSMCIGRSRQSETARGSFHYQAIPASYYSVGIDSIQQDKIAFMMATPEKALADLLVSTRKLRIQSSSAMMNYLENDLRLDSDDLIKLDASCFYDFAKQGYKSNMLAYLGKALESLGDL